MSNSNPPSTPSHPEDELDHILAKFEYETTRCYMNVDARTRQAVKTDAKTALLQWREREVAKEQSLLRRWMESFDDDGNLDGYTRDYIKQLQHDTYAALHRGMDKEQLKDN